MLIKILLGFILIALVETLNGVFRINILYKFSKKYAQLISFVIGSFVIVLLNLLLLPWLNLHNIFEAFFVGILWGFLMLCYDIFVGKVLFKLSWEKVFEDFNIFKGNLLSIGIAIIIFLPSVLFNLGYLD